MTKTDARAQAGSPSGRQEQSAATTPLKFKVLLWLALAAVVGGIGYADYITGFEVSVLVFYFVPVGLAAWRLGLLAGFSMAVLSAAAWGLSNHYAGQIYSSQMIFVWNNGVRLTAFLTVAWLTARNVALLARERATSMKLRKTLAEVNVLEGLLPVCTSCKRIRNDQGNWEQMERYIQERSSAKFSHGYCPECARKWVREGGLGEALR